MRANSTNISWVQHNTHNNNINNDKKIVYKITHSHTEDKIMPTLYTDSLSCLQRDRERYRNTGSH